ncbi:MAG: DUF4837 family protein [Lewinella sp.]|nr:DUF4837 family protein [Lewinella sp.]
MRMNKYGFAWVIAFVALLGSFGCSPDVQRSLEPDPIAFGRVNQVVVIADTTVWEGPLGDSLRYYFMGAYPILPQPEPIFDLRHFTPDMLQRDPLRKELRNYIILADLEDSESATARMIVRDLGAEKLREAQEDKGYGVSVGRDKWAKGQTVVYMYGFSEGKVVENIVKSFPAVAKRLHQADAEMVEATTYFNGENRQLEADIQTQMDLRIRIPGKYFAAINDSTVMWLRLETTETSSNILLHRVPYTDPEQLSYEGIKAIRNQLGREYISSTLPDTYMRINDVDLPMFVETTEINGSYALEARGIWDIVNDYMGGAFVSYLLYNPEKRDLLFMDAFIHAPGKEKRDLMQQMEYILHTAKY